jgi:transcription elongation factor GreB
VHRRWDGDLDHPGAARLNPERLITPEGERRLRDELERLWNVERPKVTREVSDAAAQGDRSENAEYIYGKKRLREIDRRVQFLAKRLEDLVVVRPRDPGHGRVEFGAWVRLESDEGESLEVQLVGVDEFDPKSGRISVASPVGSALLGRAVGEEVRVVRPRGPAFFTILEIWYGERS